MEYVCYKNGPSSRCSENVYKNISLNSHLIFNNLHLLKYNQLYNETFLFDFMLSQSSLNISNTGYLKVPSYIKEYTCSLDLFFPAISNYWAQLLKTNDVVSWRFVKISIFLLKKCEKLLHCKSFSHFCNKHISVFGN